MTVPNKNIENLPHEGLIRVKDLIDYLPFGKTYMYYLIAEGLFPKPIKFSKKMVLFRHEDVHAWFKQQG